MASSADQHSANVQPHHSDSTETEEERELKHSLPDDLSLELAPWVDVSIREGRASNIVDHHFPVSDLSSEQSLSIVSCGPAALCDEVRSQAKASMAHGRWKSVQYIEECFSW